MRFFLRGVEETAIKGRDTFQKILALRTQAEEQVSSLGKRVPNARAALAVLYRRPVISAAELEHELGVSKPTAHALVRDLEQKGGADRDGRADARPTVRVRSLP